MVAAFALFAVLAAGALWWTAPRPGAAQATVVEGRGLAEQLRYIGRDPVTGMPAPVDDRFIAAAEEDIARYGKDEREAFPPPPTTGPDVAAVQLVSLGVDARVARYGLDRFGRLDVPQDSRTVSWHPGFAGLPGTGTATFFAAHYEYLGVPGVFFRLASMAPGDEVEVTLTDGAVYRYRVTSAIDYALAVIDMGAILQGREGAESITLMTCSGPPDEGAYPLRTVVLAVRVPG